MGTDKIVKQRWMNMVLRNTPDPTKQSFAGNTETESHKHSWKRAY